MWEGAEVLLEVQRRIKRRRCVEEEEETRRGELTTACFMSEGAGGHPSPDSFGPVAERWGRAARRRGLNQIILINIYPTPSLFTV